MKKFWTLLALPFLALTSCGNQNRMYGTYSFMLGKDKPDETHFGVEITLSEKAYANPTKDPDLKNAKNGQLKLNLSDDIVPEPDPESPNYIEALFVYMVSLVLCDGINGYYIPKEGLYEEGQRLAIGYEFELPYPEVEIPIDSTFVENFIVAYYDSKARSVKLILPTSLVDLQNQLFWYGYFVDFLIEETGQEQDPIDVKITLVELETGEGIIATDHEISETEALDYKIDLPDPPSGRVDRIGTHPTQANVETIKSDPHYTNLINKVSEISGKEKFNFRDYHSLTVELQKQ